MHAVINPEFRFKWLWLLIGYGLIVLVVYLSLTGNPVRIDTSLPYQDKLFHTLAYFVLAFWFLQIYHIKHHMVFLVVFLLCLGVLMEYLQGLGPARYSEAGDMAANAIGVVIALALSRTRLRFMLVRLERFIK